VENCLKLNPTDRLLNFSKKTFAVDKMHIKGHTEQWCLENCNPNNFKELNEVNTMVCEQINFTLGRYKYIMKHMSSGVYNFYLYIFLNELNKIKINGRFELFSLISKTTFTSCKRNNSD